jgi:basic membrane protein A and related proteins
LLLVMSLGGLPACKREGAPPPARGLTVGLVTDVGGRGDQSFNDSALRGLEAWAAGVTLAGGTYRTLSEVERTATIPEALRSSVTPLGVRPLVVQSRVSEDYQPNLQLLVDQGADLIVATGFMLENAVEAAARANPRAKFLLIDSQLLDAQGSVVHLPNVRTVVFREEEGSYLVGALAGLTAKETLGFVGGMDTPLIRRFEAGYRAGVAATNPKARVLVQYTGSFDDVAKGKQAGADLVAKGCEVIFQAAGADGLGVVQAVKEARASGRAVLVVGTDSDQWALAPGAVLSSMLKRVDLVVWQAARDLVAGSFTAGDLRLGLAEGGVDLAEVRVDLAGKAEALARVQALRAAIARGELTVPTVVEKPQGR